MNIFDIPLFYIGFNKKPKLEQYLSTLGFTNINHFKAIDGRKLDPKKLLNDNIIGVRAYNDIIYGRSHHIGISSMGTIGCSLSHSTLWKLCADKYDNIIILEDDIKTIDLSPHTIKQIQLSLSQKNGAFISTRSKKDDNTLYGLYFYALTNRAAKMLYENALPIEMQTDSYVGHIEKIGKISIGRKDIAGLYPVNSTTGDQFTCVKCMLPKGQVFYVCVLIGIIILIILSILFYSKFRKVKSELNSCRSSCHLE